MSAATVGASGGGSMSVTFTVVVPIKRSRSISSTGEDLLLQITPTKETNRKELSWKDDVTKAANAPKATSKAKTAPSLEVATEI